MAGNSIAWRIKLDTTAYIERNQRCIWRFYINGCRRKKFEVYFVSKERYALENYYKNWSENIARKSYFTGDFFPFIKGRLLVRSQKDFLNVLAITESIWNISFKIHPKIFCICSKNTL